MEERSDPDGEADPRSWFLRFIVTLFLYYRGVVRRMPEES